MLNTTKAIVLSKVKYGDHSLIVKCYTLEYGIVSYMLKGTAKKRRGTLNNNYFQPLAQLELQTSYRSNRSLQTIKEAKVNIIYNSLYTNIFKSAITMFLAEVLGSILKEEEQNVGLFDYLESSLTWLDIQEEPTNFHLIFLLKLTQHLGFYPNESNDDFKFFNLETGQFEERKTSNYSVDVENLTLLKQLLGITFDALSNIRINSKQRQSFLNMILLYFELHLGSFKKPKSLLILNQVFS